MNVTPLELEPLDSLPARSSAAAIRSAESGSEARTVEWVTPLASAAEPTRLASADVRSASAAGVPLDDSEVDTESADGRADERMLEFTTGPAAVWAAFWSLRREITIGAAPSAVPVLDGGPVRSWIGVTDVAWSDAGAASVDGGAVSSGVDAVPSWSVEASATTVVVVVASGAACSVELSRLSAAEAGCAPSVSRQNPTRRPRSATHRRGLTASDVGVSLTWFRTCS